MGTVWVLLVGRGKYKLNNNLDGFKYEAVFSSAKLLKKGLQEQEGIPELHWVQYGDRFEGTYFVAEYERMLITTMGKFAVIAIPITVDYYVMKPQIEREQS